MLQLSSQKKTPRQTVGAGRGDLPGEGKDDLIIMQISREVKTYLVKTFNFLNATGYSVDEMDGWRLYAFFRVPSDCPCVLRGGGAENGGGMSLIQRMRQRAVAGELPTSEPRRATGSEKEGGEGQNTSEGKKRSLRRLDVAQEAKTEIKPFAEKYIGGNKMLYDMFIKCNSRGFLERAKYISHDPLTGKVRVYVGRIWRGRAYNAGVKKRFLGSWDEHAGELKKAYLVTITPYDSDNSGNYVAKVKELAENCNSVAKRARDNLGALAWRALEQSTAEGTHAHILFATKEEWEGFQKALCSILDNSQFKGHYHIEEWDVRDRPEYLVKTCTQNMEEIGESFDDAAEEKKQYMREAMTIWTLCKEAGVNQFSYPKKRTEKELRQNVENTKSGKLPGEETEDSTERRKETEKELRGEARKTFKGSPCSRCKKPCIIAQWLKTMVFGDNSLPYMTLAEYMAITEI